MKELYSGKGGGVLCIMCGSVVYCVGALYSVWSVGCLHIVREFCIVCGSFVYCVGALYSVKELCMV